VRAPGLGDIHGDSFHHAGPSAPAIRRAGCSLITSRRCGRARSSHWPRAAVASRSSRDARTRKGAGSRRAAGRTNLARQSSLAGGFGRHHTVPAARGFSAPIVKSRRLWPRQRHRRRAPSPETGAPPRCAAPGGHAGRLHRL